jgi:hypothetical protein
MWYIRESSVAVMVSNIICTWQLIQRLFQTAAWDPRSAAGDHESNDAVLGPNGTVPRTIGGTPRVPQGTPDGGFRARFKQRRDPNASLFSSIARTFARSTENVNIGTAVYANGNNEKASTSVGANRRDANPS